MHWKKLAFITIVSFYSFALSTVFADQPEEKTYTPLTVSEISKLKDELKDALSIADLQMVNKTLTSFLSQSKHNYINNENKQLELRRLLIAQPIYPLLYNTGLFDHFLKSTIFTKSTLEKEEVYNFFRDLSEIQIAIKNVLEQPLTPLTPPKAIKHLPTNQNSFSK